MTGENKLAIRGTLILKKRVCSSSGMPYFGVIKGVQDRTLMSLYHFTAERENYTLSAYCAGLDRSDMKILTRNFFREESTQGYRPYSRLSSICAYI